jgi:hypothetical protein
MYAEYKTIWRLGKKICQISGTRTKS